MNYRQEYEKWLASPALSEDERNELKAIANDEKEIENRFYGPLEFGTAGLRGTMYVGLHNMNRHVIRWATQGFANVIRAEGEEAMKKGVAICMDCRVNSMAFARAAAEVEDGVFRMLRVLGYQQEFDLLFEGFDLRFQFRDLPACHFAHLLVLVVGQDVFGFGQVGDGRAVAFRGFDDRFQLPVFLVELDELLDVGDHFGIGEFLADLFVFELQTVQSGEYGIVCHII